MEENEKIKIIKEIIDLHIKVNPNRDDAWYGEKFDELYDKSISFLKNYLILSKNMETTLK